MYADFNHFWHAHPYWLDPQGSISLLHSFQCLNWQGRHPGCCCLLFISRFHPVLVTLCRYLIHRTAERNATALPLVSPMLAAYRCQPSVPSAQWREKLQPQVLGGGQLCYCQQKAASGQKMHRGLHRHPNWWQKNFRFRPNIGYKE